MGGDKLLTISIAAYNAGSSLERTLSSLECDASLMELLDIIIVDDGSTDATPEIAARFAAAHPGSARVISKSNGGYGSTVNTSVRVAAGKYFKLLDGDDTVDRKGLDGLLEYLMSFGEAGPDLVITPFFYEKSCGHTGDADTNASGLQLCDRHRGMQTEPVAVENAKLDDGLMMFELCVRTDVLRRSGVSLTEHCYYTDNEYVMAAELYASEAVRYPFPVYRYSIGVEGQSMSVAGRRLHREDKVRAAHGVFGIYERYIDCAGAGVAGTRKLITDKLLSTMVREVYVSLMIQEDPAEYREMLDEFDRDLAERWPYVYKVSGDSRLVQAVRRSGRLVYPLLCGYLLRTETKRMEGDRAGTDPDHDVPGDINNTAGVPLRAAEYIAAACMIIQFRTVYMHLRDYGMIVNRSVWAVMMAAVAVCIIYNRRENTSDRSAGGAALLCAGFAVYAAIFIAVNPVNYLRVIRCSAAVIIMLALVRTPGGRRSCLRILGAFRDIMVVIAAVSLICWMTGSVFKFLPCTGYCWMDWSATGEYVRIPTFMGIYFETQWTDWSIVQARNSGIFVEAPMAGCAYSIALLAEYMRVMPGGSKPDTTDGKASRRGMMRVCILAAAIFSTLSLISYGFLLMIAGGHMMTVRKGAGRPDEAGMIVRSLLILAGAAFLAVMVISKMQIPSGNVRFSDFAVGFHAWLAHPFFGGGFDSLEYLQGFMPEWRSFDVGFSNSPMEVLGQGGIYLAVPYVYAFLTSMAGSIRNGSTAMGVVTVLFAYLFTFMVIPYQYITFFFLILMAEGVFYERSGIMNAADSAAVSAASEQGRL